MDDLRSSQRQSSQVLIILRYGACHGMRQEHCWLALRKMAEFAFGEKDLMDSGMWFKPSMVIARVLSSPLTRNCVSELNASSSHTLFHQRKFETVLIQFVHLIVVLI